MKKRAFFYLAPVVLLLLAVVSARSTLGRMKKRDLSTNGTFFELAGQYEGVCRPLIQLEDSSGHCQTIESLLIATELLDFWQSLDHSAILIYDDFIKIRDGLQFIDPILIKIQADCPTGSEMAAHIAEQMQNIQKSKKHYNNQVRAFNTYIKQFPRNFYSSLFHFQAKDYFIVSSTVQINE